MNTAAKIGLVLMGLGTLFSLSKSSGAATPAPPSGGASGGLPPEKLNLNDGSTGAGQEGANVTAFEGGGRAFIASLPANPGPDRERAIFQAVASGFTRPIEWLPVTSTDSQGNVLTLYVMADALAVGTADDWVRVSVTHPTAQNIADLWTDGDGSGAYLLTSKIADLIAQQAAVRLTPTIESSDPTVGTNNMAKTWVMQKTDDDIEAKRNGLPGLVVNAGKDWVNTPRLVGSPGNAANYGFYVLDAPDGQQAAKGSGGWSHGPGGKAVWQNVGLAHDLGHTDYSQVVRMVSKWADLNGATVDVATIAADPNLAHLVSDEGVVPMHHPGVPWNGQP